MAPLVLMPFCGCWCWWGVLFENYTVDASILFFVLCERFIEFMLLLSV